MEPPYDGCYEMCRRAALLLAILLPLGAWSEVVTNVEYGTAGGESLRLDVSMPDGKGPFPVVLIVHGGGWSGGDKEKDITPLFEPLTKSNFTWFSINYRMAPTNRWPACLEDVQSAIRWVKAHAAEYKGDPHRIAIAGHSAGGHLICLAAALAKEDTQVQAVVGLAPPIDLVADSERRGGLSKSLQNLLDRPQELNDEVRAKLADMSPINHLESGLPPFLLIHGDYDKTVPFKQSLDLQSKLKSLNVPCQIVRIPGAPHAVTAWNKSDPDWQAKMIEWLNQTFAKP